MAKLFQTRLKIEEQSVNIIPFDPKINQGSTTPLLPDPKIEQGSTTPILSDPKIEQGSITPLQLTSNINQGESVILKNIKFNPNQGEIEISPVRPIRYDTADQLSLDLEKAKTDYFVLRQSNLLRQNLPTILPLLSPGLSTVPLTTNRSFARSISLEDRLAQSKVAGNTTGLPQFFLSDFYIGVLPDITYSFTPNQGGIIIQALLFNPNQGSITITNIQFNPNQGSITIAPFNYNPNQGDIVITLFDFLPNQGTVVINGVTYSISNIPLFTFLPNQGSVIITPYGFIPGQDAETVITQPISISQILFNQGTLLDQSGNLVSFLIPQLINAIIEQGSVNITEINFTPEQGTVTLTDPEFTPSQGSTTPDILSSVNSILKAFLKPKEVHGEANLNILGYELDRLLARTLPEVKHGSTLNISSTAVPRGEPSSNYGIRYTVTTNNGKVEYIPVQPDVLAHTFNNKTILSFDPSPNQAALSESEPSLNFGPALKFDIGDKENYLPIPTPTPENPPTVRQSEIFTRITNKKDTPPHGGPDNPTPRDPQLGSGNLRFDDDGQNNSPINNLESYINAANQRIDQKYRTEKKQQESKQDDRRVAGQARQTSDNNINSGYVKFNITSIRDGVSISFKPYLTAFSDNWTPTYTDVKYVGRQDIQKVFTSVTRTVSVGFKMAATSKDNLTAMYGKVQSLIQISALGATTGQPYLIGPMLKVTVGDYLVGAPCVATSLKIDTNPSEFPWEIDDGAQGTHFLDLSMEFTILADNNGRVFSDTGVFVNIA